MTEQNEPNNLENLIQKTTDNLRQQQDKAEVLSAQRLSQPQGKQILTLLLLAGFAGALYYQYPRILEPYTLPDAKTDPTVVEADLEIIGEQIETYRLAQGKYPESLDQVGLASGQAKLLAKFPLEYRSGEKSYTLEWKPHHWHATFASDTGKLTVVAAKDAK